MTAPDAESVLKLRDAQHPLDEVAELLGSSMSNEHRAFIDAARVGPDEVRESLRSFINRAVGDAPSAEVHS
jgi:hypothetical protein